MKKYLLLLIVPLLFFNSCEEEDENNCQAESIQCGEIINIEVYPPDPGTASPNSVGVIEIIGAHEGYSIITLRNCNTGNEGTYCTGLDFANNLGDVFCPELNAQSVWGNTPATTDINGVITSVVISECVRVIDGSGDYETFN